MSTTRLLKGPGKKGSLSEKAKSPVQTIRYENGLYGLGYLEGLKERIIPHVFIGGGQIKLGFESALGEEYVHILLNDLEKFPNRFSMFIETDLPEQAYVIGIHEKKGYVVANHTMELAEIQKIIAFIIQSFAGKAPKVERSQKCGTHHRIITESKDVARVYGKTAFNTLAHILGEDFVLSKEFDRFREWLVDEDSAYDWPRLPYLKEAPMPLPEDAHWCTILPRNCELMAVVSYFNEYTRTFILGPIPQNDFAFPIGMICDWKNKQEYTLIDWVLKLCKDNNSF